MQWIGTKQYCCSPHSRLHCVDFTVDSEKHLFFYLFCCQNVWICVAAVKVGLNFPSSLCQYQPMGYNMVHTSDHHDVSPSILSPLFACVLDIIRRHAYRNKPQIKNSYTAITRPCQCKNHPVHTSGSIICNWKIMDPLLIVPEQVHHIRLYSTRSELG